MAVIFTDDFNRADQGLEASADWTAINGGRLDIISNALASENSGQFELMYLTGYSHPADQYAQMAITAGAGETKMGPFVRGLSGASSQRYGVKYQENDGAGNATLTFDKIFNGSNSFPANAEYVLSPAPTYPFTLRIEAQGTTVRALIDGVEIFSRTDLDLTSGEPGIGANNAFSTAFRADNFESGDFVSTDPALTVTPADLPLIPGGTISGTYANYATIPTTLTVSDGTNTITIASPTITDNGDGTGSFSGTMPALPTTGTANLVLFGDVTVELS